MHSLLDQDAPGLAKELASLSPERWQKVFTKACLQASQHLADLDENAGYLSESLRIRGALSPEEVATAVTLAEAADAKYLESQKQNEDQTNVLSVSPWADF